MITEKDLEAEFTKETGLHRIGNPADQSHGGKRNSNRARFDEWVIEKLLEFKNESV